MYLRVYVFFVFVFVFWFFFFFGQCIKFSFYWILYNLSFLMTTLKKISEIVTEDNFVKIYLKLYLKYLQNMTLSY